MKQTILIHSEYLSNKFQSKIYLKPEWYGETGSHKDKWAKSAIEILKKENITKLVVMSSGNLGLAIAAQAYKNKIKCKVITFNNISKKYIELFRKYHAELISVNDLKEEEIQFNEAKNDGYFPLSLDITQREKEDLIGSEGFKETAIEIINDLGYSPDKIIIPTSFADHAKGILKGFEKANSTNKILTIPEFILVRTNFKEGFKARSIATDLTMPQVKYVISKTKGKNIFLNNEEFELGKQIAKEKLDLDLELSSAGAISALSKLDLKELKDKTIILILTATNK